MRSNQIKVDPINLLLDIQILDLGSRGAYLSLLLASYLGFGRYSAGRPVTLNRNEDHVMRWILGGSDRHTWERLLNNLVEYGFISICADGVIHVKHYEHGAWLRRPFLAFDRAEVLERDGGACRRCGATDHLSIDHVIPVALGGPERPENYQVLCRACNSSKGARVDV